MCTLVLKVPSSRAPMMPQAPRASPGEPTTARGQSFQVSSRRPVVWVSEVTLPVPLSQEDGVSPPDMQCKVHSSLLPPSLHLALTVSSEHQPSWSPPRNPGLCSFPGAPSSLCSAIVHNLGSGPVALLQFYIPCYAIVLNTCFRFPGMRVPKQWICNQWNPCPQNRSLLKKSSPPALPVQANVQLGSGLDLSCFRALWRISLLRALLGNQLIRVTIGVLHKSEHFRCESKFYNNYAVAIGIMKKSGHPVYRVSLS